MLGLRSVVQNGHCEEGVGVGNWLGTFQCGHIVLLQVQGIQFSQSN